ncbi:MAG: MBL fold metallo-hydrolase [Nitrosarchaeum sp.]|nr:MBL fold metallo-hydrolase [Nitrosarchaeum sp.]MCA9819591.1 MBL fold metallo-hydrolase [Nitrosarchaeum sp.]
MSNTEISAQELKSDIQKKIPLLILDLRSSENFMNGHVEGSANAICTNMQQKEAVISKLPKNQKIILVDEDGTESAKNASTLSGLGFDAYFLKNGIKSWTEKLVKSSHETMTSNESLWDSLKNNKDVLLLDVREPTEFTEFKIPGSVNIPLSKLFTSDIDKIIPRDKKIVTICSHGNRAMVATFALAKNGYESTSLEGGLAKWNQVLEYSIAVKKDDLIIIQVEKVGKGCLSYIVGSEGNAIVVDPTYPPSRYLEFAKKEGLNIIKVIDTHQHADHVSAAKELSEIANAQLYFSAREDYKIKHTKVDDGEFISVGKKQLKVVHTPGHTAGSMTYVLDNICAFCGDTLFTESIGRPDLRDQAEEFADELYETLHNKLLNLPQNTKIFPTHHGEGVKPIENGVYFTTPKMAKNLPLLDLPKKEFVSKVVSMTTPRPMNYSTIIKVNRGDIPLIENEIPDLEMGPNRCSIE